MRAILMAVGGTSKPVEIVLILPALIGRGTAASLKLPHPLVSRRHCELFEQDSQLMVRDLGSLNGTFVGNQRVTQAAVPSGELLTVGTITFRVNYDSEMESDATDPAPRCSKEAPHTTSEATPARPGEQTEREFPVTPAAASNGNGSVARKTELRRDSESDDAGGCDSAGTFFEGAS